MAFSETGIEEFVAPNSLKTLEQGVFFDCVDLRRAELNEGLETLGTSQSQGAGVFGRSTLESVRLPSTLKKLGGGTFFGCESLT